MEPYYHKLCPRFHTLQGEIHDILVDTKLIRYNSKLNIIFLHKFTQVEPTIFRNLRSSYVKP